MNEYLIPVSETEIMNINFLNNFILKLTTNQRNYYTFSNKIICVDRLKLNRKKVISSKGNIATLIVVFYLLLLASPFHSLDENLELDCQHLYECYSVFCNNKQTKRS